MNTIKRIVSCTIFLSLLPLITNCSAQDLEAAVAGLSLSEQQTPQLTPWTFSRACALGKLGTGEKQKSINTLREKHPRPNKSLTIRVTDGTYIITDKTLKAYPALQELTLETVNPEATIIYEANVPLKTLRCISSAYMNIRIINPLPDSLEELVLDMTTTSDYYKEAITIALLRCSPPCKFLGPQQLNYPLDLTSFFFIPKSIKVVTFSRLIQDSPGYPLFHMHNTVSEPFPWYRVHSPVQ